ncbi:MAG TPA: mechanosensitive ion channel family protein, partial [Candidatus Nanopelagicales bacterium]
PGSPRVSGVMHVVAAAGPAVTSHAWWNNVASWFSDNGVDLLVILVSAVVVRWVIFRLISRVTATATKRAHQDRPSDARSTDHTAELTAVLMGQRREQRAESMGQLLRSTTTVVVFTTALLLLMAQLGINIAPLLASAGVVGVALGFGAQTLVKDFLSGIFLVTEDQFGVGDIVDLGPATGTVEEVGLRITRVRDSSGIVWYVRNGEILRVGNRSQGWTMAVVDFSVAYDADLDAVRRLIEQVGKDMDGDPAYDGVLFGTPTYVGVESVSADGVLVRVTAKAAPGQQAQAGRDILERLKLTFDRAGIRLPMIASPAAAAHPDPPATPRTPRI